jgi:hypothetical protein
MKLIKKLNQFRRDCNAELKCENCEDIYLYKSAYDDRNFWDNVIPNFKCKKCGKSSIDLGIVNKKIQTKYNDYEQV